MRDVNTIDVDNLEINEVGIGQEPEYIQMRFSGSKEVHYALYDSGA